MKPRKKQPQKVVAYRTKPRKPRGFRIEEQEYGACFLVQSTTEKDEGVDEELSSEPLAYFVRSEIMLNASGAKSLVHWLQNFIDYSERWRKWEDGK